MAASDDKRKSQIILDRISFGGVEELQEMYE
jgi:hypothetical protein